MTNNKLLAELTYIQSCIRFDNSTLALERLDSLLQELYTKSKKPLVLDMHKQMELLDET